MLEACSRRYVSTQLNNFAVGDEETFRTRHTSYFVSIGEHAAPHLTSAEQSVWLDRRTSSWRTYARPSRGRAAAVS
jgi:hypothetical protein